MPPAREHITQEAAPSPPQPSWLIAAEYRRLLEERKANLPARAPATADGELLRKLKHESSNVYDMLDPLRLG